MFSRRSATAQRVRLGRTRTRVNEGRPGERQELIEVWCAGMCRMPETTRAYTDLGGDLSEHGDRGRQHHPFARSRRTRPTSEPEAVVPPLEDFLNL
jgi:hypothetical protein